MLENVMRRDAVYFTTRLCLIILFVFLFSYILRISARIYTKITGSTNKIVQLILFDRNDLSNNTQKIGDSFNWTDFYPFGESYFTDEPVKLIEREYSTKQQLDEKKTNRKTAKFLNDGKTVSKIKDYEKKLEKWITENCIKRFFFLEKANYLEVLVKWNLTNDDYNATENIGNGHFSGFCKEINVDELSKSIVRFSRFLNSEKIPLLYVQTPYKICKYDERFSGILDFSNQNADAVLENLKLNNINTFDLRESIHAQNKNHYDLFFKTDHHWKPETGFWATNEIIKKLNSDYDLKLGLLKEENFDYKVYKKALLGSYGKKITRAKTEPDDFTLIIPKKEYQIHFEVYDKHDKLADNYGSFEAMLDYESIESDDLYGKDPFHGYGYGSSNNFVENLAADNEYKILLIGDSFTNVIIPFLALETKHIDRLDLRCFNGSLESFIKANGPYDICLVLYNPDQYNQTPGFVSHEELFDFR